MPRRAQYKPDRRGIAAWLANDPKLQASMERVAEEGKTYAESISPVETGEYKGSFGVEKGGANDRDRRASATLYNDSDHAAAVEFGQNGHHVLARTASVLGAKRRRR